LLETLQQSNASFLLFAAISNKRDINVRSTRVAERLQL
jgi:hypothetical protein